MKKFFANHYEKVILVALLILSVGLLSFQLTVVRSAQDKKVEDIINRKDPAKDFPLIPYSKMKIFSPDVIFNGGFAWTGWKTVGQGVFVEGADISKMDLMTSQPLAVCPYCTYVIPASCFPKKDAEKSGECPKCHKELKPRTTAKAAVEVDTPVDMNEDTNGNEIPDRWEKQYNLFVADREKNKAGEDPDGDGFTNLEEFKAKTNPLDPKSHVPYVSVMKLDGTLIARTIADFFKDKKSEFVVDMKLASLSGADIAVFDVTMMNPKKQKADRPKKARAKVGEEIVSNKISTGFKVTEIIPPAKGPVKKGAEKDFGSAKIQADLGNGKTLELHCFAKKVIQMPDKTVNFELLGNKMSFNTGDTFSLGTEKTGVETYTITSASGTTEKDTVVVLTGKDGKTYTFRLDDNKAESKK